MSSVDGVEAGDEADSPLPTIDDVPGIMQMLESEHIDDRDDGVTLLSQLIDATQSPESTLLAEFLREAGAIQICINLLKDPEPGIHQRALMVIGNLSSDTFDANSAETKTIAQKNGVVELLIQYLNADDWVTQLYAAAALQNLSLDAAVAAEALDRDAPKILEQLLHSEHKMVVNFSAGAFNNISRALEKAKQHAHYVQNEACPLPEALPNKTTPLGLLLHSNFESVSCRPLVREHSHTGTGGGPDKAKQIGRVAQKG